MALWAGLSSVLAGRLQFEGLVPPGTEGTALFHMMAIGGVLAIVVQPAVGAISDHSVSRWGRRKPYIVLGSLADLVFLAGIATSNTVVAIAAFIVALQVSSNIAQGPYQGYVPDLVPARQVGLASGLIGLMLILGNVVGFIVGAVAIATGAYAAATVGLGVLETATMSILVTGVRERGGVVPRDGRSWRGIALGAWGRDLLHERDFLWFLGCRLLVLTGGSILTNLAPFLPRPLVWARVARGGDADGRARRRGRPRDARERGAGGAAVRSPRAEARHRGLVPPRRDRAGDLRWGARRPRGLHRHRPVRDLVRRLPRSRLGPGLRARPARVIRAVHGDQQRGHRSAGLLAVTLGGTVMDLVGGPGRDPSGPRAALALGAVCFGLGAVLLRPVREPGRA